MALATPITCFPFLLRNNRLRFIVGTWVVVHRLHHRNRVAQLVEPIEGLDHLSDEILVNHQTAAVGLPVEAQIIELDPTQLLRRHRALRPPRGTQVGCGHRRDDRILRRCPDSRR